MMAHKLLLLATCHTVATSPFAAKLPNTSFVALRFHQVASTSFKYVLSHAVQPSYMEHEGLVAYQTGGLNGLRCLGAPYSMNVVFICLFRKPARRILSALHFYANFPVITFVNSHSSGPSLATELLAARHWVSTTECSRYDAANVSHALSTFARVPLGEAIGGGMLTNEYSHYFNVHDSEGLNLALTRLRQNFVVGLTEDMHGLIDIISSLFPPSQREEMAKQMKADLQHHSKTVRGEQAAALARNGTAMLGGRMAVIGARKSYCDASDVLPRVLVDIGKLSGYDVALYEGAMGIYEEQRVRPPVLLPVSRFSHTFSSPVPCITAMASKGSGP